MKRALFGWLVVMSWSGLARASDYSVAPDGDDTHAGDAGSPFQTIQHAVDLAVAGDTITVRGGTYNEGVHFAKSGAPGQPIVLRAYPDEHPVVEPPDGQFPILIEAEPWQDKLEIGWITVEGFELRNATTAAIFEITNAHDLVIKNNYLHDGVGQGILGTGHDVLIDGNEVARCGDPTINLDHGMYLNGRRFTIVNNIIHDNASFGIQVAAYACGGICAAPDYSGAVDWLIAHNVFAFEKNRSGIVVWEPDDSYGDAAHGELGNIRIVNNLFLDNNAQNPGATNGVDFWSVTVDPSSIEIDSNMFSSAYGGKDLGSSADNAGVGADMATLADNVHADPLLADPLQGDFHPTAMSPAIDSGADVPECAHDVEGNVRPHGAHWDVGPYEFGSSPGSGGGGAGGNSSASSGVGTGSSTTGAGPSGGAQAGSGGSAAADADRGNAGDEGGCTCTVGGAPLRGPTLVLMALAALALRRRRVSLG